MIDEISNNEDVELLNQLVDDEGLEMLEILTFSDKKLKEQVKEVTKFDDELQKDIKNIFYTMRSNELMSISAPQVGINKKILVLNIGIPAVLINPVILEKSKDFDKIETSCITFPGYFMECKFSKEIIVAYKSVDGIDMVAKADDLVSFAIQQDIVYLNNKTFLDRLSFLKRNIIKRKFKKNKKRGNK